MENVMPICIKHRDKNAVAVQQTDISRIIIEMRPFLQAKKEELEKRFSAFRSLGEVKNSSIIDKVL